jgi:N-acetylmuramic acid 6-phosphate etherase
MPSAAPSWGGLATEARLPASRHLDTLSTQRIAALVIDEDRRGLDAARRRVRSIARAAEQVAAVLGRGGRVLFVGAGTSGRLGVLEAAECPPTFGSDPERIVARLAGGDGAVFRAVEGAEDDAAAGAATVSELHAGDLLIGLSASSVTPYVRGALNAARRRRLATVLVTCAAARGLETVADMVIALGTGPEVLTGSTRLKAGSATKAVLNAITTAAMVRLGKTFENLMVDLRPGSAKLRDRAQRIVAAGAQVTPEEAARLLAAAAGEVKTALVMGRTGLPAPRARARLRASRGHVRQALEPVTR